MSSGSDGVQLSVSVNDIVVVQISVTFGTPIANPTDLSPFSTEVIRVPAVPVDLEFEQMASQSGHVPFFSGPEAAAEMFPKAAVWLGAKRVLALMASTCLVGMICPGLHSVFAVLSVKNLCRPFSAPPMLLLFE